MVGKNSEYKNNSSVVGKLLRHVYGLPFLPPVEVGDCFVEEFMADKPEDDKIH